MRKPFTNSVKIIFYFFVYCFVIIACSIDNDVMPILPTAEFSFSPENPKVNEEVSFTNESTDADSYQWSAEGTNFSSTEENPKFTFNNSGSFVVKLVATNDEGSNEITRTIAVQQNAPTANFSFSPTNPETGQEVSFTNESSDGDTFEWSAEGTNFSSTEENPKFTFNTAGDYSVKLIVTNSAGSDEITKQITVTQAQSAPVANFSFSPSNPKTGQEVSFTNESSDGDTFQWSAAGTNFSSTEENPKFTFNTAGDYSVKLIVTNSAGSDEITKQITVTDAQSAPVADFSFSPTNPKTGQEVSFTNESSDGETFQWSAEGTNFSSTEENPKFTFDTAGDYSVKLIVTNSVGSDEVTKQITVTEAQSAPVANFSFSPTNPETGQEVSFTNESSDGETFQWSAEGTNFSSTEENPKFIFDTAGDYSVKLIVTNSAGSDEITKQITVTDAQSAPVADFSFSPTNPETGQEVSFTNESSDGETFQWSAEGTNFSSTEENPKFTFNNAGDYSVKLIVTNSAGSDEITKQITVTDAQSAPVADFSFSPTNPETGQEVSFTNESSDGETFQWSAAGTNFTSTEENPKFTFDTAGDYSVKLIVTNSAGSDEITKQITVTDNSGGGSGSCNLPNCYVEKTETSSFGMTTTVTYDYVVINGKKLISAINTSAVATNIVVSIQYDSQGRRIKDENRVSGNLQSYVEYTYTNNDRTVRADTYDSSGNLTSYSISQYDSNDRLTRTDNYSASDALTGYTIYSDFYSTEGSFPQLVETFDANGNITQTDKHTYQDCQLLSSESRDGNGNLIGEIQNTIDSNNLLRTSVSTVYSTITITSTTNYTYDCDS